MKEILQHEQTVFFLVALLLSMIAYFIKQLHSDFRRVVKEMEELKSSSKLIHSETRSANELLKQRMDFFEFRLDLKGPLKKC